jgi:hypothetical protein
MAAKKDTGAERRATERRAPSKTAKPTATPFTFSGNARAEVSPDELRKLISEAAYYRAKQRGFAPGHELEDWIQAEAEVMGRIGGRPNRSP